MNLRRLSHFAGLVAAFAMAFVPAAASATAVQVADGADVAQGAVADPACATDNGTCSIQAMLKRIAQRLTTLNTTVGAPMQATGGQVQGNAASAATDSGNPVKVGCVFNSTLPTFTTGQRGDCQLTARGSVLNAITDGATLTMNLQSSGADGLTNSNVGLVSYGRTFSFNGSTWDRSFTCTSSATVNVTAGSTTQIVALSGSTVIRVCAMALSMSAAGQAGVYTGTGTNCGTGSTALVQDMTLPTGTPLALSAPSGGSLVRSSAGGELCVKAVTGNVTGFISYAQF